MMKALYPIVAVIVIFGFILGISCENTEKIDINTTSSVSYSDPSDGSSSSIDPSPILSSWGGLSIPAPEEAGPNEIWLDDYESRPNVLTVKAGTTVTWINYDNGKSITLLSDDDLFVAELSPPMGKFSFRFEHPGIFGYNIDPYGGTWEGVVVVTE